MSRAFGESVPRKSQRQENVPAHIFTPRSYQVEILDTALQRNTIVCLGSSSGKAFIATMLIKSLGHQVRAPFKQGGKRTIFLANTREKVEDMAGVIARETSLSVGRCVSCKGASNWDKDRWDRLIAKYQVLAFLPKVLLKLFERSFLSFSDVNLVIFDECECSVLPTHTYADIMRVYLLHPPATSPRILGLTASVLSDGVSTPVELEAKIRRLEETMNSAAETSTDMIVADLYGAKPKELVLQCAGYEDTTGMVARIEEVIQSSMDFLNECNMPWGSDDENPEDPKIIPRIVFNECLNILHLLGPWCAGRVAHTFCKQLYKMEDVESDKKHRQLMQMAHTTLQMIHTMVDYDFENVVQCLEDFLEYMSPKVLKLLDTLSSFKPDDNFMIIGGNDSLDMDFGGDASDDSMELSDDEDPGAGGSRSGDHGGSKPQVHYVAMKRTVTAENGATLKKPPYDSLCGIIFVERRHTAFALNKLIEEMCSWNPDLFFIQSCHISGKSNHKPRAGVRKAEVVHRKQEEVLRQFRNKDVNLLVSTNVLEEGVDVPRCNLVFRFDPPPDYRSYVQSKGRARAPRSTFYMLVDEPNLEVFTKTLDIFKGIENILLGRCQCREELREERVEATTAEEPLDPYVPNTAKPCVHVTMSSAILLVNRYCAKLPSDAFTHLTPKCTTQRVQVGAEDKYVATLQLPINSPIKEPITGEPMSSKRVARMAVALKTCEILHRKGELDDNLLPVGKEVIRYEDEEGEWEETQGQARPGTTKRKQYYYKKPADALLGHPQVNQPCYLYSVRMVLSCPITEEQNTRGRKIHDPEETTRGFGILSEKPIPLVPRFPVFTRSGEVTTSIDLVSHDMVITENDYRRLKRFHHTIFTHVLRLEKDPMKFDMDNAVTSYIIVPLLRGDALNSFLIDWKFIDIVETAQLSNSRKLSPPEEVEEEKEKAQFVFNEDVFDDAVVMPSYRNIDQPQYFYVAEIRHDLSPKSPFPSPELYDTFEHYYASKYSLDITNVDQPLLDVDHTSARLNLLTPRYMNQKGVALPTSSAETRRARRENLQQKQILMPELCDVHPFPASLWRKAVCLPAILYRMNCLLIADEIRMMIACGAHIGEVKLPNDYRFPQLEFGFSTKPSNAIQEKQDKPVHGKDNERQTKELVEPTPLHCLNDDKETNNAKVEQAEEAHQPNEVNVDHNSSQEDALLPRSANCGKMKEANNEITSVETIMNTEKNDGREYLESITKVENNELSDRKVQTVIIENKQNKAVSYLITEMNGLNLSDIENKEARVLKPSLCNGETADSQGGKVIENGLSVEDCNCVMMNKLHLKAFSDDATKVHSPILEAGHNEAESLVDAVALDAPLFIDTSTYAQGHEDTTFHTPRLSLQDLELCSGPPSQSSVSSYNTADTSLSAGPSPVHTRNQPGQLELPGDSDSPGKLSPTESPLTPTFHSIYPHSITDLQMNNMATANSSSHHSQGDCSTDTDFIASPIEPQIPTGRSEASQQIRELTKLALSNLDKESSNCDIQISTQHSKQSDCLCSRNGTIRMGKCPQHMQLIDSDNQNKINAKGAAEAGSELSVSSSNPQELSGNRMDTLDDIEISESPSNEGDNCDESTLAEEDQDNTSGGTGEEDNVEDTALNEHSVCQALVVREEDKVSDLECEESSEDEEEEEMEDTSTEEEKEEDVSPKIKFDKSVDLEAFIGPSPCIILQTMTMSNANDFFNLERLETIGDSFLKFAITVYLYCTYPGIHEGKLSYLRSKQVSNYNLYKLGKKKGFPDCMVAAKFEPTENWLPPGFVIKTSDAYRGINVLIASTKNKYGAMECESPDLATGKVMSPEEKFRAELEEATRPEECEKSGDSSTGSKTLIPYNLQTQHSLPDKSIADCVEALIGCYLTTCGQRAALQFMSWLGLKVLPELVEPDSSGEVAVPSSPTNCNILLTTINRQMPAASRFGHLRAPCSPLLTHVPDAEASLMHHLDGYEAFERRIHYKFHDRSYLLQAFTHASYHYNTITDCYQRLEFLGDAILDYVITRHLFEDVKKHSPGILTDLRSALVNNNIFAALAVKWDFHKFFKAISPQLFNVTEKFVARQKEKGDEISLDEEFDFGEEEVGKETEDIEIPKALGDIFESVAGAIYLDSGMSLDTVWRVYYRMMKPQIDMFTAKIPKSPVRELLELEPETAKFEKPERTLDGKIRVMVNVVGKGEFRGIGRNYRIAKSAAAKRALKMIRVMEEQMVHQHLQALKYGLPQFPSFSHHNHHSHSHHLP